MNAIDRLTRAADRRFGVFTWREARAAGVTRTLLDRCVREERIVRAFHGIYCFTPTPKEAGVVAAWMFVGEDAVASHQTALQLYDLAGIEARRYEFIVPTPRRRGPLFQLHTTMPMPPRHVVQGVPATSAARAIVDSAPLGDLTYEAVTEAIRRDIASIEELRSELRGHHAEVVNAIERAIRIAQEN